MDAGIVLKAEPLPSLEDLIAALRKARAEGDLATCAHIRKVIVERLSVYDLE